MTTGFDSNIDHFGLGLTKEDLVDLYRTMLISRRLDEKIWALNRQGRIPFVVSVSGHEATQVGIAAALDPKRDWSLPYYRDIAFNIGLGRDNISEQDITAAADYVYANEFIDQLPGGYQFQCRNNGGNLSVGQGQLIAFARAIAGGNEVVMLDEATSSVDSITEQLIQRAINHVFMEKTFDRRSDQV